MRRTMTALLLFGLLASLAPCQETTQPNAQERYEEFQKAWREHQRTFFEEQRAAVEKARAEGGAMISMRMMGAPVGEFITRAETAAADFAGTDGAVPFLIFVAQRAMGQEEHEASLRKAVDTLMTKHVESPAISALPRLLGGLGSVIGKDAADAHLRTIEQKNPEPSIRAWAIITLESDTIRQAKMDSADYKRARAELMRAKGLLGDEPDLAAHVQGMVDEREKLAVGMPAPDIEGVDLDGMAFKLSDYKGKIILLDFWGDW